ENKSEEELFSFDEKSQVNGPSSSRSGFEANRSSVHGVIVVSNIPPDAGNKTGTTTRPSPCDVVHHRETRNLVHRTRADTPGRHRRRRRGHHGLPPAVQTAKAGTLSVSSSPGPLRRRV